jgi:hypothetical protein
MKTKVIALLASAAIGMAFIEAPKTEKELIPTQTEEQGEWTPLFDEVRFCLLHLVVIELLLWWVCPWTLDFSVT